MAFTRKQWMVQVCCASAVAAGILPAVTHAAQKGKKSGLTIGILTRTGRTVEGSPSSDSLSFTVEGKERHLKLKEILSLQLADPASVPESDRIKAGLEAVAGTDRKAREAAAESLTDIGLAALTPLLDAYKDTDAHEPKPLYRLFARLIPSYADGPDRTLDLVRLADGTALRGDLRTEEIHLTTADGSESVVRLNDIRRLAVRRPAVDRTFDIHSLYHCSQIEFLDSGLILSPDSRVTIDSWGFTRLAFGQDGWSSDPDGLKKPGPNYKTNLVDGFPFGALIGRVGAGGARWMAGKHAEKSGLPAGRLYLAINDNPHWQNNLGSYRVRLRVSDAYDLGDPQ